MVENINKEKEDKSKFLYEYQLKQYDYVKAQTIRLDDKSAKYLTFISLIMATTGIISKYYFFDIKDLKFLSFEVLPIIFIVLSFLAMGQILTSLFRSIKVTDVGKLSAGTEMISFIKTNSQCDIYEGLADDLATIVKSYEVSIKNKTTFLDKAFKETATLGILLILLLFSIIIDMSTRNVEQTKPTASSYTKTTN